MNTGNISNEVNRYRNGYASLDDSKNEPEIEISTINIEARTNTAAQNRFVVSNRPCCDCAGEERRECCKVVLFIGIPICAILVYLAIYFISFIRLVRMIPIPSNDLHHKI